MEKKHKIIVAIIIISLVIVALLVRFMHFYSIKRVEKTNQIDESIINSDSGEFDNESEDKSSLESMSINQIEGLINNGKSIEFDSEAEEKSNFILMLTNQSYDKPTVNIEIYIDGKKIISQKCKVENQHKGYYYYFTLDGEHEIRIKSDDGQEIVQHINLDIEKPKWHIITYHEKLIYETQDETFLWI